MLQGAAVRELQLLHKDERWLLLNEVAVANATVYGCLCCGLELEQPFYQQELRVNSNEEQRN